MAKTSGSVMQMLLVACAGPEHQSCQNGWTPNCFSNSSHIGNMFIVQFYLPPNTEGQRRGQKNEAKTSRVPMQSVCGVSCCVSLLFMMWSRDGRRHLISCQFHFSVFHNIWSMDIPTCQTSGPLFLAPSCWSRFEGKMAYPIIFMHILTNLHKPA